MTSALRPTPSTNPYATPEKNLGSERVSVLTPKTTTPTKRKLFDSPPEPTKRGSNEKTGETVRKVLSSIVVPQTPARKAPGSSPAAAAAASSPFSPNGLFLPDLGAFSPEKTAAAAAVFFSPNGLPQPDFSGFSPKPTTTPMKGLSAGSAAAATAVLPNALILTKLKDKTPEPPSMERTTTINSRMQKLAQGKLPQQALIERLVALTKQTTFSDGTNTYTKGKSLGRGQFVETFATDKTGVVVKVLHEEAIFFDVYGNPNAYWEGVEANYSAAAHTGLLARLMNGGTVSKDMFSLQETVIPLDNLKKQDLEQFPSPIFPQVKHILDTFLRLELVIEAKKGNLGISRQSGKVVVHDTDQRADFDDAEGNKENLAANLRANIATFGPVAAKYLTAK